jgi:hypothetical protein
MFLRNVAQLSKHYTALYLNKCCEALNSNNKFLVNFNSFGVFKNNVPWNHFTAEMYLWQTFLVIMATGIRREPGRGYTKWDPSVDGVTLTWRDVSVYTIIKENLGLCRRTKQTCKRIINNGM